MTDRELLEAAAKAAGIEFNPEFSADAGLAMVCTDNKTGAQTGRWWNPLTDDGDALRLAVKLQMEVDCFYKLTDCSMALANDAVRSAKEWHKDSDTYAATRRAIVRAAAEIGRLTA
jgi:hypothetical protein